MSNERDLPEGNADSIKTPSLASSGLPPLTPHGSDATADATGEGGDGSVEDAALSSGADPDLRTDADVEETS